MYLREETKRTPAEKACQLVYSSCDMGGSGFAGKARERKRREKEEGRRERRN